MSRAQSTAILALLSLCLVQSPILPAAEDGETAAGRSDEASAPVRHLVIFGGHPGDDEHRERYVDAIDTLTSSLTGRWGFSEPVVLFGTEQMLEDGGPVPEQTGGACTFENMQQRIADLTQQLRPQDAAWLILIGHTHWDGRHTWFNAAGPDPNEEDLATLLEGVQCAENVVWVTTATSGFFIRSLSAKGRVVITATEADREISSTLFPEAMAAVVAEPPSKEEFDADGDGQLTLLDLYVAICGEVANRFVEDDYLQTEHALLDDNGDRRGTEVQQYYLSEELGGALEEGEAGEPRAEGVDGYFSSTIPLSLGDE